MDLHINQTLMKFTLKDFVCSQSRAIVGLSDIRRVLEIHVHELREPKPRSQKDIFHVKHVEENLTPSGLKKLGDVRTSLRMYHEQKCRDKERLEDPPPAKMVSKTDNYDLSQAPQDPDGFIRKMHAWGTYGEDDCRYYLHMVFRFYFKDYHDSVRARGLVVDYPSYQFILDMTDPTGCATRFPPEFRIFLTDSSCRAIRTQSLPVPLKGSATKVIYKTNFETDPHVTNFRRGIQREISAWKSRPSPVYPKYLSPGSLESEFIRERVSHALKVQGVMHGLERLGNVSKAGLDKVVARCPVSETAHDDYTKYKFHTSGEQLKERMGFFMRPSYRELFFIIKEEGISEELYLASGSGMDAYMAFETFCTRRSRLLHDKDEDICRIILMAMDGITNMITCYTRRQMALEDPQVIVSTSVRKAES